MTSEKQITCINCPMGCRMTVTLSDGVPTAVTGNTCKRGETYARQEVVEPLRMVTAVLPVAGSTVPVSVKTRTPVPKARIAEIMATLRACRLTAPIAMGAVVCADVCGTGVDVIATRNII